LTILALALFAARLFARDIIDGCGNAVGFVRYLALRGVQGKFYTFEGQPVRLYFVDDDIWVPERDLAAILLPAPGGQELRALGAGYGPIAGQNFNGFSEAALLRMLETRTAGRQPKRHLVRFRHWLQEEALPNVRRLPESASGNAVTETSAAD
jgi:prophage antirepressor-like protein